MSKQNMLQFRLEKSLNLKLADSWSKIDWS